MICENLIMDVKNKNFFYLNFSLTEYFLIKNFIYKNCVLC